MKHALVRARRMKLNALVHALEMGGRTTLDLPRSNGLCYFLISHFNVSFSFDLLPPSLFNSLIVYLSRILKKLG